MVTKEILINASYEFIARDPTSTTWTFSFYKGTPNVYRLVGPLSEGNSHKCEYGTEGE